MTKASIFIREGAPVLVSPSRFAVGWSTFPPLSPLMWCIYLLLTFVFRASLAAGFGRCYTCIVKRAGRRRCSGRRKWPVISRRKPSEEAPWTTPPSPSCGCSSNKCRLSAEGCDRHLRRLSGPGGGVMLSSSVRMGGLETAAAIRRVVLSSRVRFLLLLATRRRKIPLQGREEAKARAGCRAGRPLGRTVNSV